MMYNDKQREVRRIIVLNSFMKIAREKNASDLHIAEGVLPMMRIDGKLVTLNFESDADVKKEVNCVAEKIGFYGNSYNLNSFMSRIVEDLTAEQRSALELNGELDFALENKTLGRSRINIYREDGKYALAIRLIKNFIPCCKDLGIPGVVQNLIKHKYGLILVTGPTGSGKTTTLASLVQKLNEEEHLHIITLEDPIEYVFKASKCMINQREVGKDTKSFASGLKSALREDPDVILVGELRDSEALNVALQAAETGHLVISTLHTRDTVSTVSRIIDMLPTSKEQIRAQLADCLLGIVSQNLIKKKDGCGRCLAMEILLNNNAVGNLIREGRTHQLYSYIETSGSIGMQTMAKAIADLKKQGII